LRTLGGGFGDKHLSPVERRNVKEKAMYDEGFDVQAVRKRLKTEYAVEQQLPLTIALWLQHLRRREEKDSFART
jgi:hypothetical protein